MGRPVLAVVTFVALLLAYIAVAWVAFFPSVESLWTMLGCLFLGFAFLILERLMVGRVNVYPASPAFLVRGFPFAVFVMVFGAVAVGIIVGTNIGSLRMAGSGMSPTLENVELVLYHRHTDESRLLRGRVIAYRLSNQSAWGQSGLIVISRIQALPGERLSIRGSQYVINGQPGSVVAPTGQFTPVIAVPQEPETIQIPDNCYFIVQDSPEASFDSRVLGWVQRKDIISTNLYYLGAHDFLKSVK
jgi:signal peptidase I